MKVKKFEKEDFDALFMYWKKLGKEIPYFFSVSPTKWFECMFADKLNNEIKFLSQKTFVAKEKNRVIGFIQCGQPAFAWDENGQKYSRPRIGIIRHLYFDTNRFDVANHLFSACNNYMERFPQQHAFYHIFGMSCNAHHGKLYERFAQVGEFLCNMGYQVEHENLYYCLELRGLETNRYFKGLHLDSKPESKPALREYDIYLRDIPIGMIQIQLLEKLTGQVKTDITYMTWIGIDKSHRRQGWGSKAIQLLAANLQNEGFQQIHLDTASSNVSAQQFYEHLGFQPLGKTRSFIRNIKNGTPVGCSNQKQTNE